MSLCPDQALHVMSSVMLSSDQAYTQHYTLSCDGDLDTSNIGHQGDLITAACPDLMFYFK